MMINVVKSDGRIKESLPLATTNLIILHEFTGLFDSRCPLRGAAVGRPGLYAKPPQCGVVFEFGALRAASWVLRGVGWAWYTNRSARPPS